MGRGVRNGDALRGAIGAGGRGEGGGCRELRVVAEDPIDGDGVAAADVDVPIGDRGGSKFDGICSRIAAVCGLRAVVEFSGKIGSVVSMQNCGMQLTTYGDVRLANAVAPTGTRPMAPPRWWMCNSACTGKSAERRWKSAKVAIASSGNRSMNADVK